MTGDFKLYNFELQRGKIGLGVKYCGWENSKT